MRDGEKKTKRGIPDSNADWLHYSCYFGKTVIFAVFFRVRVVNLRRSYSTFIKAGKSGKIIYFK